MLFSLVSNSLTNYGRRHFKLFTNCHVSWDTLYHNWDCLTSYEYDSNRRECLKLLVFHKKNVFFANFCNFLRYYCDLVIPQKADFRPVFRKSVSAAVWATFCSFLDNFGFANIRSQAVFLILIMSEFLWWMSSVELIYLYLMIMLSREKIQYKSRFLS